MRCICPFTTRGNRAISVLHLRIFGIARTLTFTRLISYYIPLGPLSTNILPALTRAHALTTPSLSNQGGQLFQIMGLRPDVPKAPMAAEALQTSKVVDNASQIVPDAKVRWLAVNRLTSDNHGHLTRKS